MTTSTETSSSVARIVSIIVPCRNESAYIERFCQSALGQTMPADWALELVIADGMSDDDTRDRLGHLASADSRVVWIDNPHRITSSGLNRALARAAGSVIVRMDVHSEYAPDYVEQCLAVLAETGASNVGGAWKAEPEEGAGSMQQAVAMAFQSRWVAGGALSRRLDYDGWVDTVYLGCWPRLTFERFGNFDESLVRNQDDEHNLRIVRGGGHVWQSSRIRSVYRPRRSLSQVFRQYAQYGYWKPFVMRKFGQPAAWRQLVPGTLVLGLTVSVGLAAFGAPIWSWLGLPIAYGAALIAVAIALAIEQKPKVGVLLRLPVVVAAYQLGYGLGFIAGCWDALRKSAARDRFAALTR
ncbi:glycosyltransferase family 2 protein [Variovorax sp. M-6]|uniref:glycosyltransferase family 2 protein n=1 Tax=Variovorax sp. M-6 TaxID=3233041 RepID=UPI003F95EFBB